MKTGFIALWAAMAVLLFSCKHGKGTWDVLTGIEKQGKWKAMQSPGSFVWKDTILECSGTPGYFIFDSGEQFSHFILEAEVKTEPYSFAGLFFHQPSGHDGSVAAGYGVVVGNTTGYAVDSGFALKTGSLEGIRNVWFQIARDGEWFTLKVKVTGNHIETFVNGIKVNDYIQPVNPWRSPENRERLLGSGTFAIRHSAGTTCFKSIRVMALPRGETIPLKVDEAWDMAVTQMAERGFPLIDFHVHLKGGLTIEEAIENSQMLGINYGIAPNCGLKFPVTDDVSLAAYMDTVRGMPVFRGMQAEGREWITLFSPEAVAKFDYVFTDALTFTDSKGRRTRMWIPEEVWIDDKQQFMDQLVGKIEAIILQEPVDIYVNPTLLPAELMPGYDQLWTRERMNRVIRILAENNVALEINARYKVPGATFIKMAKEAGLKFSFGTNNAAAELGQLEYCLQMAEECGLTPSDMFLPVRHEEKPVLVKGLPEKITG